MIIAIIILVSAFVILFGYMCLVAHTERREERKRMSESCRRIDLASAGSDKACCDFPRSSVEICSIDTTVFTDKEGKVLDPAAYNLFIADGNSMRLCGIYDRNLIFATKTFNILEARDFPIILIIGKMYVTPDRPAFKIRRAWQRVLFSDDEALLGVLRKILGSESFQEIRILPEYPGDDKIIEDFQNERLERYKLEYIICDNPNEDDRNIVISSTLDTASNVIHFSIHPVRMISGEVVASFDISTDRC